jgi:hypothetical protein
MHNPEGQTMSNEPLSFEEEFLVGSNPHGYSFYVGRLDDRWLGYAIGAAMVFVFPGISTDHRIGVADRDEAIRRLGAIAQDPASGYGGIKAWFVEEALRGDPVAYRCKVCGEVCCGEDHDADDERQYWEDFRL